MCDQVRGLKVRELLADSGTYCIPMYQRNYAWGEGEITQLVLDVQDYLQKVEGKDKKPTYYIGTLVVYPRDNGHLEIIDGQQRFTTLTLLAIWLKHQGDYPMGWYSRVNLEFESRPKSSHTLSVLCESGKPDAVDSKQFNPELVQGFELLKTQLKKLDVSLTAFCDYLLEHVQITLVPVPKKTDLNHYFEVMNSRGEQLEKHEILKARLLGVLTDDKDREAGSVFSRVWDAVSNMERYIQYGFTTSQRHRIFGADWGNLIPSSFEQLRGLLFKEQDSADDGLDAADNEEQLSLAKMLQSPPGVKQENKSRNDDQPVERFNSIINFSNFLLHVLRVWTRLDVSLDDKQLLEQFDHYLLRDKQSQSEKIKEFTFALLKCKFLFDHYVIKRDAAENKSEWNIQCLTFYSKNSQSYVKSFGESRASDQLESRASDQLVKLQSALHVSTPTLAYKHWLNGALNLLYQMDQVTALAFLHQLEHLARQFVYGRFLNPYGGAEYYQMIFQEAGYPVFNAENAEVLDRLKYGNIENNLVFNYLDYLIWREATAEGRGADELIQQFEFTFRSSVEHFSPQTPMEAYEPLDKQVLHRFGNLCLISHSKNSRLSNFQPDQKRGYFQAAIKDKSIDSLKLYRMIQLMESAGVWDEAQIAAHEQQMLRLLEDDSKQGTPL